MYNGLKPIPRDPRDLSFHRTFGGFTPPDLPAEFSVDNGMTMPDQIADKLYFGCTGYSQNELCSDQDGVVYDDYEFTYRKTLEKAGIYTLDRGCDMRDSLSVLIVFGPRKKGEGDTYAHRRGRYYTVEVQSFDWFDSIRSVMYTNWISNQIKVAVSIGTPWFREFDIMHVPSTGIVPTVFTGDPSQLAWHNWAIKGWKVINGETFLVGKTWQGKNVGDKGWYYFRRETINAVMKIRGTAAFTVAPRRPGDEATIKKTITEFLIAFMSNLVNLFKKKQESSPVAPTPVPTPAPVPEPVKPKYDWSDAAKSKNSVRIICDEEGLSSQSMNIDGVQYKTVDVICAVIQQESQFNNKAINKNRNAQGVVLSTDWGICQINDYYHVGPGKAFSSVPDIVDNPDKAVRFMIKMHKQRLLKLWVAYSSGAFKKYLPK